MRRLQLALLPAGVALAAFAEWAALRRGSFQAPVSGVDVGLAGADLAAGLLLVGGGVAAWSRRPESRIGALLAASGFAWFLGTFAGSGWHAFATFGSYFVALHRGPLAHALLSYPTGQIERRRDAAAVAIAYGLSAVSAFGTTAEAELALAGLVLAVAGLRAWEALGPERRARLTAAAGASLFGGVLVIAAVERLSGSTLATDRAVLWAYDLTVAAIAALLALDLLLGRWVSATVTGLVVDLGEPGEPRPLRDRLAAALGDRSLQVGYRLGAAQEYVDERGRALVLPTEPNRRVTVLRSGSEEIGALVHDADLIADEELVESVASAALIAVTNVRLQAEVRRQVDELEASRRRLVEARDAERRRLERDLREGAQRRLGAIDDVIRRARAAANGTLEPGLVELEAKLGRTRVELHEFGRGVHPRFLTEGGLAAALQDLVDRAPSPVELSVADERFTPAVEASAYFVCSEAVANAVKHAGASVIRIDVSSRGATLLVTVADDGRGGARLDRGSGLRGLDDRVSSLGGRLRVTSPAGGGTQLVAELPLA